MNSFLFRINPLKFGTRSCSSLSNRSELFAKYPIVTGTPRECWIESLEQKSECVKGIVSLHPDIWAVAPRLDLIADNLKWQELYKKVEYNYVKDRHELPGKGKRPWPKKGTGRARHASTRSPIWIQGGKAHGPKGPRTWYHMLPYHKRVAGLIHTLSCKFAQDDVRIVENLDLPTNDPQYLEDLIDERGWAMSTLFVDNNDEAPEKITEATNSILHLNIIPSYGLNVHSMLIHKTLVLTLDSLNHIEDKLLFALRRTDSYEVNKRSRNAL